MWVCVSKSGEIVNTKAVVNWLTSFSRVGYRLICRLFLGNLNFKNLKIVAWTNFPDMQNEEQNQKNFVVFISVLKLEF